MGDGKKLKVLQVNKLYYPWIGGVEKVVQDIAEGLKDKIDVEVLACQPKGRGKNEIINGVRVTKTSSLGIFFSMPISPTFPFHLARKSRKVDILHFHMPFPLGDISHLLAGDKNKKTVVTYHSDIVKQAWGMRLYKPLMNRFLELADKILVTSPNLMNSSEHLKPFLNKCKVVPLSIDLSKYEEGNIKTPISKKAPISPEEKIVLFVGRLSYYKGIRFLIEAMSDVSAKLIIVGEGGLKKELENMVKALKLNNKVIFLGNLPGGNLRYWYKRCDVFVLPSVERSEAFGLVQLEAMAYKKPVVNTDLPTGVPFVSKHGQTGFTVPPRDSKALAEAINKILDNDDLRLKFGENAYTRVREKFSLDKMLDSIYSMYSDLIE
jgi:rhamnosyl/mannosyltransferase